MLRAAAQLRIIALHFRRISPPLHFAASGITRAGRQPPSMPIRRHAIIFRPFISSFYFAFDSDAATPLATR